MYTDDPTRDAEMYYEEQEETMCERIAKAPECCICHRKIIDGYAYVLDKDNEVFARQMPRPVKGSGLAKGSCPIQFQRLTACPCGPNVSLPHYAFACIPRYRGLRLHRRAIDRARLFILPTEADSMPVS